MERSLATFALAALLSGCDGGRQAGQSPLHTADAGLAASGGAFQGSFDAHHVAPGNGLNRAGYWYANMSLSATRGPLTLTLA